MVLYRGSTATSLCLNGVAVLFLLDLDDLAFSYTLSIDTQTKMALSTTANPALTESERHAITLTMQLHAVTMAICIVLGTLTCGLTGTDEFAGMIAKFGFYVIGLIDLAVLPVNGRVFSLIAVVVGLVWEGLARGLSQGATELIHSETLGHL